MSKPDFAPFRVSDFAARELLYVRESLVKREHQHTLKLARDARYRERKRAAKVALLVHGATYLRAVTQ